MGINFNELAFQIISFFKWCTRHILLNLITWLVVTRNTPYYVTRLEFSVLDKSTRGWSFGSAPQRWPAEVRFGKVSVIRSQNLTGHRIRRNTGMLFPLPCWSFAGRSMLDEIWEKEPSLESSMLLETSPKKLKTHPENIRVINPREQRVPWVLLKSEIRRKHDEHPSLVPSFTQAKRQLLQSIQRSAPLCLSTCRCQYLPTSHRSFRLLPADHLMRSQNPTSTPG